MRMRTRTLALLVTAALLAVLTVTAISLLEAAGDDPSNPRANFWRWVRRGIPGFTQVSSRGHTILIQNSGENWREFRNVVLMRYGQWLPGTALAAMVLFFLVVGQDRLKKPRSGVKIERFSLRERLLHWYTAVLFVVMALTGFGLLLGRLALLPILGYPVFSACLRVSKTLHNYGGPLLIIGVFLEFTAWVRFNIPRKSDLGWFSNMGGMLGHGPPAPAGKVNGGEKAWFWAMTVFGLGVGITGVILDFPIWGQTRLVMQISHVIHVLVGVLFVTVSFGHIYVGTIGAEGAFEGMWTGSVDAVWAQQHNQLWYEEMTSPRRSASASSDADAGSKGVPAGVRP